MNKIINSLSNLLISAFNQAGFPEENVFAEPCAVPEFGDFQCKTALMLAKKYHQAPLSIAQKVAQNLPKNNMVKEVKAVAPGYINIVLADEFLEKSVLEAVLQINPKMEHSTKKIVVDYGGPNVAKPLHVGHLRSANIGESIKRICSFVGNSTIGDIHLGDWGLQMGMVIYALREQHPEWPYFDPNFAGHYPTTPPISIKDLETIYPQASAKAKQDEAVMKLAQQATVELQQGRRGYLALWKHIMAVSVADLKKNYQELNVNFELWLGESDSQKYYKQVIEDVVQKGFAHESQGALVVDVAETDDKIEVPPFMLKKSDGGVAYSTTDLATIVQRQKEYNVDKIIYVVDKRQELHFKQLFRCAKKTGMAKKELELDFAGFGTMNGKDGKPYKTRAGGVMQLGVLIEEVKQKARQKVLEAKEDAEYSAEEMENIAQKVAISALKFADLSIFRAKDYVFDIDKFCSFEGKTGPYLLYTITRANSILKKSGTKVENVFHAQHCPRQILLALLAFKADVVRAYQELAPSVLCDYVYKLANLFNSFYNSSNIINEADQSKRTSWLFLTNAVATTMKKGLELLAIQTLEKM